MVRAAYIHIPFCQQICHYCDFNKFFIKGQPVSEYLTSLKTEIGMTLDHIPVSGFQSIFVGGGTPTALSEEQLEVLCGLILEKLPFGGKIEFTFEANPGDLSKRKLEILKNAGVNRLSFGVQSFNNELLKAIGRTHRAEDVFRSIDLAKESGFDNISVDLIYGLPGQTLADFQETIQTAFTLGIPHFSGYSLIIEPKTVFYQLMKKGKLAVPGEDTEAQMYELLMDEMDSRGFYQYEISNFAIPGYESKHNLTYWNNEPYFGFGAGAHGFANGIRYSNYGPLKKYMEPIKAGRFPVVEKHQVTLEESMEEEMFLGLRKTEGISAADFSRKFNADPFDLFQEELAQLHDRSLLNLSNGRIRLTRKGRLLGNEVFESFIGVTNR